MKIQTKLLRHQPNHKREVEKASFLVENQQVTKIRTKFGITIVEQMPTDINGNLRFFV